MAEGADKVEIENPELIGDIENPEAIGDSIVDKLTENIPVEVE